MVPWRQAAFLWVGSSAGIAWWDPPVGLVTFLVLGPLFIAMALAPV